MRLQKKQSGVALILAIMIVTLATITATALTVSNARQTIRAGHIIKRDQAFHITMMAENIAISVLNTDSRDNNTDDSTEDWNTPIVLSDTLAGINYTIEAQLSDIEQRLNINNILSFPANKALKPAPTFTSTLNNLIALLDINLTKQQQEAATESLNDWLDNDSEVSGFFGAEEYYYLGLDTPYQIGNKPLVNVADLRQIRGFDTEVFTDSDFKELRSKLHTVEKATKINVNTASRIVLESLGLNKKTADEIENQIATEPYASVADFLTEANKQIDLDLESDDYTVQSTYFLLEATATIDKSEVKISSIIERDNSKKTSKVIQRIIGDY